MRSIRKSTEKEDLLIKTTLSDQEPSTSSLLNKLIGQQNHV